MPDTISMALYSADTAGKRAAARRRLNQHVRSQVADGQSEKMVRAGIKASIRKLAQQQGKTVTRDQLDRLVG